jgi:hypothetical protein
MEIWEGSAGGVCLIGYFVFWVVQKGLFCDTSSSFHQVKNFREQSCDG